MAGKPPASLNFSLIRAYNMLYCEVILNLMRMHWNAELRLELLQLFSDKHREAVGQLATLLTKWQTAVYGRLSMGHAVSDFPLA